MMVNKRTRSREVKAIQTIRAELDDRVGSKADIIGSMIGIKVRGGALTNEIGVTYFVREKVRNSDLSPKKRVPPRLRVQNTIVKTDVLQWPGMVEQASPPGLITFDGKLQGTLSCFAVSPEGAFGLTCAHCLRGVDENLGTPTVVSVFSASRNEFIEVGETYHFAYSPGIPGEVGYLDCGLFHLKNKHLFQRAIKGQALPLVKDMSSLMGQRLYGISTLSPDGSTGPYREADVIGVNEWAIDDRSDLVLAVYEPGMYHGDSGMLWLTKDGKAAGVHAKGERMPRNSLRGSALCTAMSAARVSKALGVRLVIDRGI